MTLDKLRVDKRSEILRLAELHGCCNVRVFGSVASGETKPGSDVDFLVDLEKGRGLLDLGACSRISRAYWVLRWTWSSPDAFIRTSGTVSLPRPCLCSLLCRPRTR